ncbi:MAG: hypothetical protein M3N19_07825, partial [Candidatus Eremiobacteraeota bacterium]|nr:hypothetical protein [Candidatus Eremiobacteraeota bacterium]
MAIVAWPFIGAGNRARASLPPPAVVLPDYSHRDQTVAFLEKKARGDKQDQITARMLAAQYMQRYRENGDVDDIKRAIAQGKRSLVLQPQNSSAADEVLGSAYTALHKFHEALKYETAAHLDQPYDSNAPAQMASLEMELGNYEAAQRDLVVARKIKNTSTVESVQARYDELTGNQPEARTLIQQGMVEMDAVIDNSAQGRAWYHFRAGELAFSAGAIEEAKADERYALTQFPNFELAYRALARFCWATKDWRCALDAAAKGAAITPLPETLGYEADAQTALGDTAGAQQTQALIFAIERIGNAYRLSDRLLSVYYSEHGIRLDDSLKIAQREVAVRGDEIYAQDTLAWAAAMDGRWDIAHRAAARAIRFNTADPRIAFHAGMI